MAKINFIRGEFITHLTIPGSFAIYGGEELEPLEGDDPNYKDFTLICYHNPTPKKKDKEAKAIFDADIDDQECQYVISEKDAFWWRRCNSDEKYKALKTLAEEHGLAWEENENKLRHLGANEKLVLDDKPAKQTKTRGRQNIEGRVPFRNVNYDSTDTEKTVKPIKKTVLFYPSKEYKQAKKIAGIGLDMVGKLQDALTEYNRKESSRYYGPPYRGSYSPAYGGCYGHHMYDYDEFWGD